MLDDGDVVSNTSSEAAGIYDESREKATRIQLEKKQDTNSRTAKQAAFDDMVSGPLDYEAIINHSSMVARRKIPGCCWCAAPQDRYQFICKTIEHQ